MEIVNFFSFVAVSTLIILCLNIDYFLAVTTDDERLGGREKPLILTPYIKSGKIAEARNLSYVQPFEFYNYTSYAGFITVNSTYNSNLFFWFFFAKKNYQNAPVLLFFNGGPGTSALFGLFGELGPHTLNSDLKLVPIEFNWVDDFNVIFVDLPIGAGFSFTSDPKGYARNDSDYAVQALSFIPQFYTMFPEFVNNDFYLVPESYSGKPALVIGAALHNAVSSQIQPLPANFKGLIIISGFIDPETIIQNAGEHLYNCGLINERQRLFFQNITDEIMKNLKNGQIFEAASLAFTLIYSASATTFTYFTNFTGFTDFSDLRTNVLPSIFTDYEQFVQQNDSRSRLHVGNATFHASGEIASFLIADMFNSQKHAMEYLLDNDYKILFINGIMDLLMNPVAQRTIARSLNWKGKKIYENAERIIWRVEENDKDIAGYVTAANNFVEVLVRNAGHMIPHDQPRAALDAVLRFVNNKSFN